MSDKVIPRPGDFADVRPAVHQSEKDVKRKKAVIVSGRGNDGFYGAIAPDNPEKAIRVHDDVKVIPDKDIPDQHYEFVEEIREKLNFDEHKK